jgi:hypothetical protein
VDRAIDPTRGPTPISTSDPTGGPPIRIGSWFQGPTGSGQGGWTAQRFVDHVLTHHRPDGAPALTAAIRAPIPLDTDLRVVEDDDGWRLVDPDATTIMTAAAWTPVFADTDPVSIDEAAEARRRFGEIVADHPVPFCFSCGTQHDSMNVHAGPIGGDRFATDWTVPDWAVDEGDVDHGAAWAALDCTAAWWMGYSRERRLAFTVQYAVEITDRLEPGGTYALVAWSGDHDPEWDGRKRHAASAAFDADGNCVARSVSLWVSVD